MCTQKQAMDILKEAYCMCSDIFPAPIARIFLYGSYARGDYHEWSDVDILATVDIDEAQLPFYRQKAATIASDLSLEYDITVSLTIKPVEQFERYKEVLPFYSNVIREGIAYAT